MLPNLAQAQAGPLLWPNSVVKDKVNLQKLFVTERRAIQQLTLNSWEVSTFFESAQIEKFKHLVQDSQGDVFVTAGAAVYKIGYKDKVIQLLAGAPERSGFDSLFFRSVLSDRIHRKRKSSTG